MASHSDVHALPGFVAMDALSVLRGGRRGASVQITDGYLAGQRTVLEAVDPPISTDDRSAICRESRRICEDIHIDIDTLTEGNLREASVRFRRLLQRLPEVSYLERHYPETCFVVPEWVRTPGEVRYGARVYFFADDAPDPESVMDENIRAVTDESPESFERYQGSLHGYPECCIDFYAGATRSPETDPESQSIAPLEERVRDDRLERGSPLSWSFDEVLRGFFDDPQSYAFFAHEFYPEPGCETARRRGVEIYETLAGALPEPLVRDYFRFNFGWSYLMAKAVRDGADETPEPGRFGREHALLYLPLRIVLELY
ncbi:MAG: hypothetical protein R6U01_02740 [Halorubrum sp.]|uniref:hypothetical protein n=1 Tax=Halorubrum sp. TaxID=1879286 RepID=UPI003970AE1F